MGDKEATNLVCIYSVFCIAQSLDLCNPHLDILKYNVCLKTQSFGAERMGQVLSYLAMFCWISLADNAHV